LIRRILQHLLSHLLTGQTANNEGAHILELGLMMEKLDNDAVDILWSHVFLSLASSLGVGLAPFLVSLDRSFCLRQPVRLRVELLLLQHDQLAESFEAC
jgi:hypothetical protein